ncbi:MAG: efflux RND transporter periplasmic adaptor subunit, partial [Steroidobacteraceae bacterium]
MNYRIAFWAALAAFIALLGAMAGFWWSTQRPGPTATMARRAGGAPVSGHAPTPVPNPAAPAEPTLSPLQLTPQRLQSIGVRLGEVQRRSVEDQLRTTGNVAVDETKIAYVQLRFCGYIQRVFVNATYQYVRKGQPLFTIYSPDLVATEREYLLARQNERALAHSADPEVARDAASLVESTAARLAQWNVPAREIKRLESTGRVLEDLEIDSPVAGYVTEREALPNKFAGPDTRLYTVADLSTIWVLAQVHQNDLGRLKAGDPATLTVDTYPGRTFAGKVDFIYPDIDLTTRTARVRLVFANPNLQLTPGMFVNVSLHLPMGEHEVIPASGVLQTGTRQIVFVDKGGGRFDPIDVHLGARVGDDFIVLKGLRAGERIVTSANFLIDSESQLQAALGSFAPPGAGAAAAVATASQAQIAFSSDPTAPRKGSNRVRVMLTAAGGTPLAGAQVTATFF